MSVTSKHFRQFLGSTLFLTFCVSLITTARAVAENESLVECETSFAGLSSEELIQGLKGLSRPSDSSLLQRLKDFSKPKDSSFEILDNPTDLDHTILGPDGQAVFDKLNQILVGHTEAKLALALAVQRGVTGTSNPNKTIGNFLFLGITGVGKTLAAEALAEVINGDPSSFLILNGGELQKDHETAKVIGAPAGYKGHNETEALVSQSEVDRVTSTRYKVNILLVDEIEKASASLLRLLLGVMDKGRLTTGTNKTVDLSKTILIMTSNLGQAEMNQIMSNPGGEAIGFATVHGKTEPVHPEVKKRKIKEAGHAAVKKAFSPEFRNRIDKIFVFDELSPEETKKVLNINLARAQRNSFFSKPETSILFNLTPEARTYVLTNGYVPEFGGRSLRRSIEHLVVEPLTNLLGSKQIRDGDLIEVALSSNGGSLVFRKVARSLTIDQQMGLYSQIYGNEVQPIEKHQIAKFDAEKYNPKTYPIFLEQLDALSDPKTKLDMIEDFLFKSPDFGDTEFLDLFSRLPNKMDWGRPNSKQTTKAMAIAGFGTWEKMRFEPVWLAFVWQGMKRIDTLSSKNRSKMKAVLSQIEKDLNAWLSVSTFEEEFKSNLKRFIIHVHGNVMKLPEPK